MIRSLLFIAVVAALVVGAVWFAENPGNASFVWQGYRIETSVAFATLVAVLFAGAVAAAYRAWLFVRRTPANIGASWRERKKRKGYHALTRGMVAVAAGDVAAARKYAAEAQSRLDDPPLTMLLSAQAAQLAGDEDAAQSYFETMSTDPDMAFLGLRGRLTQALAAGDHDTALTLARRAHEIKPRTNWVADTLFDLQVRAGQWAAAEASAKKAGKDHVIDVETAIRRRAIALHQQSVAAARDGRDAQVLQLAGSAWDLAPGFVPVACHYVDALLAKGKKRKALNVLEKTWAIQPHPALYDGFCRAASRPVSNPLAWVKQIDQLLAGNGGHAEAEKVKAEAALAAELWGEAREHLDKAAASGLTAKICQMYATLEEQEAPTPTAGRDWLRRAAEADADPAWACGTCGHVQADWAPLCRQCDGFDTQTWRSPARVVNLANAAESGETLVHADPPTINVSDIPPPPDMVGPKRDQADTGPKNNYVTDATILEEAAPEGVSVATEPPKSDQK